MKFERYINGTRVEEKDLKKYTIQNDTIHQILGQVIRRIEEQENNGIK